MIEQAKREFPESAAWDWELHTTTDGDANAFAMAGGKILVSRAYVDELALNDAELAMLLAHEIMHAVLRHNLKEFEEALRIEPERATQPYAELEHDIDHDNALMRKLASFNQQQELKQTVRACGLRRAPVGSRRRWSSISASWQSTAITPISIASTILPASAGARPVSWLRKWKRPARL